MKFMSCLLALYFIIFNGLSIAYGAVDIELTQGVNTARPVAVADFIVQGESSDETLSKDMSAVIRHDLYLTGLFNTKKTMVSSVSSSPSTSFSSKKETVNSFSLFQHLLQGPTDSVAAYYFTQWKNKGYDNVLIGRVTQAAEDTLRVEVALLDTVNTNEPLVIQRIYHGKVSQWRAMAHGISNVIYKQLTGKKGAFLSSIAYVVVKRHWDTPDGYELVVADMDGARPKVILRSKDPIMSPSWSPDGKQLAYVSFEGKRANIFITELATGKRRLVAHFPGINGAPSWSPDGQFLAVVLSGSGMAKVYELNLSTGATQQLTFGSAIDTEPCYSADGAELLFTSDRGGRPQIYALNRKTHRVHRLTFIGRYNASPCLTSDGQSMVMLHREGALYSIAVQNLSSGAIKTLTEEGYNDSPSLAPDGSMILYSSRFHDGGVLRLVSRNGEVSERLPTLLGDPQQPAWSP